MCKQCRNATRKLRRDSRDKDEVSRERKAYSDNNPEKMMVWSARRRAKNKGIAFDLSEQDIIIPSHCPICHIELIVNKGGRKDRTHSPTLDRVDPKIGYHSYNVKVICWHCNTIKSYGDAEIHRKIADYIDKNKKEAP